MAGGLLSGVLPFVYRQGDRLKNKLSQVLSDPIGVAQQAAGQIQDSAREQSALLAAAFNNPQRPFLPTDSNALAQAVQNVQAGPLSLAPAGITVWHGSPHVFDAFDASKIGTGEGAQSYGHGIYTAESPDVAKRYAAALSDADQLTPEGLAARTLGQTGSDLIAAKQALYRQYNASTSPAMQTAAMKAIEAINAGKVKAPQIYKADLPDATVPKMMDWDKPLSEQPHILGAIGSDPLAGEAYDFVNRFHNGDPGTFYDMLSNSLGGQAQAAQRLASNGIPGIRYLDSGSRDAGGGTSNFVLFPGQESQLQILERNGQPLISKLTPPQQ